MIVKEMYAIGMPGVSFPMKDNCPVILFDRKTPVKGLGLKRLKEKLPYLNLARHQDGTIFLRSLLSAMPLRLSLAM